MSGSATEWRVAQTVQVQANRYVPLPESVRQAVEEDHPLHGPSVVWSRDHASDVAVLSDRTLPDPERSAVGRYKVYDADSGRARVRPPDDLVTDLSMDLDRGDGVLYLATASMVTGERPQVCLVTAGQVADCLSGGVAADDEESLREAVLERPDLLSD